MLYKTNKQPLFNRTVLHSTITYSFTKTGVHLISDMPLHRLITDFPVKGVNQLAEELIQHFEEFYGRPLNIRRKSLAIEIRGHYYFEKFYLPFRKALRFFFLKRITDILDNSLKAYDCAEPGTDPNRFIWDALSYFDPVISLFFRDKRLR